MATNLFNTSNTSNYRELVGTANGASNEFKTAKNNLFWWINQFNKLARKNEFVEGVNMHELGKLVRAKAIELGYDVSTNAPFNAYLFTKCSDGVSRYKVERKVKAGNAFAISETIIDYKVVKLSENGLINAYKYILGVDAKEADKTAKNEQKAANKAANSAKADARKALKKEQKEAVKAFNEGKMCAEEFASIMAKAI